MKQSAFNRKQSNENTLHAMNTDKTAALVELNDHIHELLMPLNYHDKIIKAIEKIITKQTLLLLTLKKDIIALGNVRTQLTIPNPLLWMNDFLKTSHDMTQKLLSYHELENTRILLNCELQKLGMYIYSIELSPQFTSVIKQVDKEMGFFHEKTARLIHPTSKKTTLTRTSSSLFSRNINTQLLPKLSSAKAANMMHNPIPWRP